MSTERRRLRHQRPFVNSSNGSISSGVVSAGFLRLLSCTKASADDLEDAAAAMRRSVKRANNRRKCGGNVGDQEVDDTEETETRDVSVDDCRSDDETLTEQQPENQKQCSREQQKPPSQLQPQPPPPPPHLPPRHGKQEQQQQDDRLSQSKDTFWQKIFRGGGGSRGGAGVSGDASTNLHRVRSPYAGGRRKRLVVAMLEDDDGATTEVRTARLAAEAASAVATEAMAGTANTSGGGSMQIRATRDEKNIRRILQKLSDSLKPQAQTEQPVAAAPPSGCPTVGCALPSADAPQSPCHAGPASQSPLPQAAQTHPAELHNEQQQQRQQEKPQQLCNYSVAPPPRQPPPPPPHSGAHQTLQHPPPPSPPPSTSAPPQLSSQANLGAVPGATGGPRCHRGYRLFRRTFCAADNYYAVPFPPLETIRFKEDDDDQWEDLEIYVTSHKGMVALKPQQKGHEPQEKPRQLKRIASTGSSAAGSHGKPDQLQQEKKPEDMQLQQPQQETNRRRADDVGRERGDPNRTFKRCGGGSAQQPQQQQQQKTSLRGKAVISETKTRNGSQLQQQQQQLPVLLRNLQPPSSRRADPPNSSRLLGQLNTQPPSGFEGSQLSGDGVDEPVPSYMRPYSPLQRANLSPGGAGGVDAGRGGNRCGVLNARHPMIGRQGGRGGGGGSSAV